MPQSQFALLEVIAREISSQLDPEILYEKVIEIALEHIGAHNSSLFLRDDNNAFQCL